MIALMGGCLGFTGCATSPEGRGLDRLLKESFASDDPCSNNSRNAGLLIGAIGGALLGKAMGDDNKAVVIGSLAGAALGGFIGADMDQRRCRLQQIAHRHQIETTAEPIVLAPDAPTPAEAGPVESRNPDTDDKSTTTVEDIRPAQPALPHAMASVEPSPPGAATASQPSGFSIALTDKLEGGHFLPGSAQLTPQAEVYFGEIAALYDHDKRMAAATTQARKRAVANTRLLLIGHTDDVGSSHYNADLSEQRAKTVASFLRQHGVPGAMLNYQGAGETLPIADNRNEAGRARNRRVEIVEMIDEAALARYLAQRTPRIEYYRTAAVATVHSATNEVASDSATADVLKHKAKEVETRSAAINPGGKATKSNTPQPTSAQRTPIAHPAPSPVRTDGISNTPINLGGVPVANVHVDYGELLTPRGGLSLISQAQADTGGITRNCANDRPRVARGVKALQGETEPPTRDYLPGLYGGSWVEMVNGHLLALNKVAVLKDAGAPVSNPELMLYPNYSPGSSKPLRLASEVNSYRSSKGLLYRVFLPTGSMGIQCMDVLFPYQAPFVARDGYLVQQRGIEKYAAHYVPRIVR